LVRRDTGVSYDDYLRQLAQAEGIEESDQRAVGATGSEAREEGVQ
jgi:hypothetical protein